MTTSDKRLDEASQGLTARERATIILKSWIETGEHDQRLSKHMPANQREECDRIIEAVGKANDEIRWACAFLVEWLYHEEIQVAWLQCLTAFLSRTELLEGALNAAGWSVDDGDKPALQKSRKRLVLPPLPTPRLGLDRDLPILWGTKAFADDERPLPTDWPGVRDHLAFEMTRALPMRWQDFAARRIVLDEMGEAMGGLNMTHAEVAEPLEALRKKVLDLYAVLVGITGPFELGEPDQERLDGIRTWVKWEDIREARPTETTPAYNGRGWMRQDELAELEALEARLAADLRAGRESS